MVNKYAFTQKEFVDYGFEEDYEHRFNDLDRPFDYYRPAYGFGFELAHKSGTSEYRPWDDVEADARTEWRENHPDHPWDEVKEAVQHAWEAVTGALDSDE